MEDILVPIGCFLLAAVPLGIVIALVVSFQRLGALGRRLEATESEVRRLRAALSSLRRSSPDEERREMTPSPEPPERAPAESEPAVSTLAAPVAPRPIEAPPIEAPPVEVAPLQAATVEEAPAEPAPAADPVALPAAPPGDPWPDSPAAAPAAKRPSIDIDDLLWRRLPVWIGAAAFALAGVYMVKLSYDRGWIGPPVQVALGVAFGIALLFGSERLRRSSAYVAHGLAAAGVAVLYAAFYAAVGVHDLIPSSVGLALMALTTGVAVLLATRHGLLVALLGLVGGFATPALVSSATPRAPLLFGYLLLLQIALTMLGLRRGWLVVPSLAALAGFGWAAVMLRSGTGGAVDLWVALFLISSAASLLIPLVRDAGRGASSALAPRGRAMLAGLGSLGGLLVASGGLIVAAPEPMDWGTMAILTLGCFAVARRDEGLHALAWTASGILLWVMAAWLSASVLFDRSPEVDTIEVPTLAAIEVATTVGALVALLLAATWWAHRGSRLAGAWLTLGALQAAGSLLLLVRAQETLPALRAVPWGAVALALGALFAVLPTRGADALSAKVAAAAGFALLAVPLELEAQWLTVVWAIQAAVLVWLGGRLQETIQSARPPAVGAEAVDLSASVSKSSQPSFAAWLRSARAHPLDYGAALAALLAGGRLLFAPRPLRLDVPTPLAWSDWPLFVYGTAAAAFAFAAVRLRDRSMPLARLFEALALLVAVALVSLEVRHVFHPDALVQGGFVFAEWGGHLLGWLGLASLALQLDRRWPSPVLEGGARILLLVAAIAYGTQPMLMDNPVDTGDPVGPVMLFDWLTFTLLLPALAFWWLARRLDSDEKDLADRNRGSSLGGIDGVDPVLAAGARGIALLGGFAWLTLEVLHAFRGAWLVGQATHAEQWAVSAMWTLVGAGLATLAALQARRGDPSRLVRWSSLAVLLLAIGKVFFFDTASLEGFYRVLSLLGLGLVLFVLAWSYRRFVLVEGPSS